MEAKIHSIDINKIVAEENSRQLYDTKEMQELMVSMKQTGLLQPIGVQQLAKNGYYKLIFGFRRFHSAKKLGWEKIDCILQTVADSKDALIKNSIENVQRANVSFPEQGRIFAGLLKKGLTGGEIAARIGCSKHFVQTALDAFHKIPLKIQKKLIAGSRGTSKQAGSISPTAAFRALSVQKKYRIPVAQAEKLYEFAAGDKIGAQHLSVVADLVDKGQTLKEAIEHAKSTKILTLQVAVEISTIQKLQQKYPGRTIFDILYAWIEQNKEVECVAIRKGHGNKMISVSKKA